MDSFRTRLIHGWNAFTGGAGKDDGLLNNNIIPSQDIGFVSTNNQVEFGYRWVVKDP